MNLVDDPRRLIAIEEINEYFYRFPEHSLDNFLNSHDEFGEAFRNDFDGLPLSRIIYFSKQIAEETERLEVERLSRACGDSFSIDEGAV